MSLHVVWFRRDLRISDNPALHSAADQGSVLPLFVLDRNLLFHPETGSSRVAFLLASLKALDCDLRQRGGRLLVRQGDPVEVITSLVLATGADGVVANTDSERIVGRVRDARLARRLALESIPLHWYEQPGSFSTLLSYPDYRRLWHGVIAEPPLPAPARIRVPPVPDDPGHPLADRAIPSLVRLGIRGDRKPLPPAGTSAAERLLDDFCGGRSAQNYYWQLSHPAARATTGISPHLKFGQITARQVIRRIDGLRLERGARQRSWRQLVSRLRWGAGMAQRFRYLPQLELRPLWRCHHDRHAGSLTDQQEELYLAWREGRTGFPIIDAAARCLLAEGGWRQLNFRSRAIHASFLVNLCGIDWRFGALHYMRHLFDGDCPIDHYQWAMHAGVTAVGRRAWTRIYHPGQLAVDRCDPQGLFIRRWLPQLADLTNDQLGAPPPMADYPRPILDYESARRLRLGALERRQRDWQPGSFSGLPDDRTPFAAARIPSSEVGWASTGGEELFPAGLDLAALDQPAIECLSSWFQTQPLIERKPPASRSPSRRRGMRDADGIQLSLFDQA